MAKSFKEFLEQKTQQNESGSWRVRIQGQGIPNEMSRFQGKTWPSVIFNKKDKTISLKKDNIKNATVYKTNDISFKGVKTLLKNIEGVLPTDVEIIQFLEL